MNVRRAHTLAIAAFLRQSSYVGCEPLHYPAAGYANIPALARISWGSFKEGRHLGSMGMEETLQYLLYLYGYEAACGGFRTSPRIEKWGP